MVNMNKIKYVELQRSKNKKGLSAKKQIKIEKRKNLKKVFFDKKVKNV